MFRKFTITFAGQSITSGPFLDKEYVHESLVRRHLFPSVKQDLDEIQPVFSSDSLSVELSSEAYNLLQNVKVRGNPPLERRGEPFSPMRYTFLKFNGNVRTIQVPHPIPYMRLAHELADHWEFIGDKLDSSASRIRPKVHDDGRVITMEYGDKVNQTIEEATRLVGTGYIVHTDIFNCFPSLYTHAIDWALRGRNEAKKNRSKANWEARIDMRVSDLQDGETNGVGIGPGTSNIVAEIILQAIDKELVEKGHVFTRYIDDYRCYAHTRHDAERFILDLNDELYQYRLTLNHRKTEIVDVESTHLDSWLHEIRQYEIHPDDTDLVMIRKLRGYQQLARKYPGSSVLIFGIKTLSQVVAQIEAKKLDRIIPEPARMVWVSPSLTPKVVNSIFPNLEPDSEGSSVLMHSLTKVVGEASRRRQADVVMWSLYGLSKHACEVPEEQAFEFIEWNPMCLALGWHSIPMH